MGIVLLDDKNGEKVASIHHKCLGDLPATNLEILRCARQLYTVEQCSNQKLLLHLEITLKCTVRDKNG